MRLEPVSLESLIIGHIVVLTDARLNGSVIHGLRMVEKVDAHNVRLEPLNYLIDDDQVTEILSHEEVGLRLHFPVFEAGDRIMLHGTTGTIISCQPNDLHVSVQLDEPQKKEIYTNIVHLDFTPTFHLLQKNESSERMLPLKEIQ